MKLNDDDLVEFMQEFGTEFRLIMLDMYGELGKPSYENISEFLKICTTNFASENDRMDRDIVKIFEIKDAKSNMEKYKKLLEYSKARNRAKRKAYKESGLKCGVNNFKFRYTKQDFVLEQAGEQ